MNFFYINYIKQFYPPLSYVVHVQSFGITDTFMNNIIYYGQNQLL